MKPDDGRFNAASPWPKGAPSAFARRAAHPILPDLAARRPSLGLRRAMEWPPRLRAYAVPELAFGRIDDPIAPDEATLVTAASRPTRKRIREAAAVVARLQSAKRRSRLREALYAPADRCDPIAASLRWFVRRSPDPVVMRGALSFLRPVSSKDDLAMIDVLAGQSDCASGLVSLVMQMPISREDRVALLQRIAAKSERQGRTEAIFRLAGCANHDPCVRRWFVIADSRDASLESMGALAKHVDFASIDALAGDDPVAIAYWLHLFSRWFEHGLNTTHCCDGEVSKGPPPPILSIPGAVDRLECLLGRLKHITIVGVQALDALRDAEKLRQSIKWLGSVPAGSKIDLASDADRERWRARRQASMAKPSHRVEVDRVLADPEDPWSIWVSSLLEDAWAEDGWPRDMAALRAGQRGVLWLTLWKTRSRDQMQAVARWARPILAIDDAGTYCGSPLHGSEQPGTRADGIGAFDDPRQASATHQTLRLVLTELGPWSGVGIPLVLAALRSDEEPLPATAATVLDAWHTTDRDAVPQQLPLRH